MCKVGFSEGEVPPPVHNYGTGYTTVNSAYLGF